MVWNDVQRGSDAPSVQQLTASLGCAGELLMLRQWLGLGISSDIDRDYYEKLTNPGSILVSFLCMIFSHRVFSICTRHLFSAAERHHYGPLLVSSPPSGASL